MENASIVERKPQLVKILRVGEHLLEMKVKQITTSPNLKAVPDDESNLAHACRDCNGPGGKGNADPSNPNDASGQKWRLPRMEKDVPK